VTEDGHVYLANSLIAGSELRAATIRGWNDGMEAPLTIYDTDTGIVFKSDDEEGQSKELFSIGANGLKIDNDYFIKIENGQAVLKTRGEDKYIALKNIDGVPVLYHHHSEK
jgi:hypothetical protein